MENLLFLGVPILKHIRVHLKSGCKYRNLHKSIIVYMHIGIVRMTPACYGHVLGSRLGNFIMRNWKKRANAFNLQIVNLVLALFIYK